MRIGICSLICSLLVCTLLQMLTLQHHQTVMET